VAAWIAALIQRHGDKPAPAAFHGEDFDRLMDTQAPLDERLFKTVFAGEDFTHIRAGDLYDAYRALARRSGAKGGLGERKFEERCKEWVAANTPWVRAEYVNVIVAGFGEPCKERRTKRKVWFNSTMTTVDRASGTRGRYLGADGHWCGDDLL
jgi:hypothetical protein